jgi:hypothetical protein
MVNQSNMSLIANAVCSPGFGGVARHPVAYNIDAANPSWTPLSKLWTLIWFVSGARLQMLPSRTFTTWCAKALSDDGFLFFVGTVVLR